MGRRRKIVKRRGASAAGTVPIAGVADAPATESAQVTDGGAPKGDPVRQKLPFRTAFWSHRPLLLAVPALLVFGFFAISDTVEYRSARSADAELPEGVNRVTATVVATGDEGAVGRWWDPTLRTHVEAWLSDFDAEPGDRIEVFSDPENPAASDVPVAFSPFALEVDEWRWSDLLGFLLIMVAPWLWWWWRLRKIQRARRLGERGGRGVPMRGVVGRAPTRPRPALYLYPHRSWGGDRPVGAIPLAPGAPVQFDRPEPVEVFGNLAPGRLAVATLEDGTILWPSGRCLLWPRWTFPFHSERRAYRKPWVGVAWTAALGALVFGAALFDDWRLAADQPALDRNGIEVTATVTEVLDEYESAVTYRMPGAEGTLRAALVQIASDGASGQNETPQRVGQQLALTADLDLPTARLTGQGYDWSATEGTGFIVAAAVALAMWWRKRPMRASFDDVEGRTPSGGTRTKVPWASRLAELQLIVSRVLPAGVVELRLREGRLAVDDDQPVTDGSCSAILLPDHLLLQGSLCRELRWDDPWSVDLVGGFNRRLRVVDHRGAVGVFAGRAGAQGPVIVALTEYLRRTPTAREGLRDRQSCAAVMTAARRGASGYRVPWRHAQLDDLVLALLGIELVQGRPLPSLEEVSGMAAMSEETIVSAVMAKLDPEAGIRERRVRRRLRYLRRLRPWPFETLSAAGHGPAQRAPAAASP